MIFGEASREESARVQQLMDSDRRMLLGCSYCERTDTPRDDFTTRCLAGTGCNTDDGGPFDPYGLS